MDEQRVGGSVTVGVTPALTVDVCPCCDGEGVVVVGTRTIWQDGGYQSQEIEAPCTECDDGLAIVACEPIALEEIAELDAEAPPLADADRVCWLDGWADVAPEMGRAA